MLISCLMPTYGKHVNSEKSSIHIVEEAVMSFLRQTNEDCELIILNDQESLELQYTHPRIRIFNEKERYKSLGVKRQRTVELARGEICAIWDDDDISLPNRLHVVRRFFTQNPTVSYAGSGNVAFSTDNDNYKIQKIPGHGRFAAAAFRREAALKVPYRDTSTGEDAGLCVDMVAAGLNVTRYESYKADHIYRWGLGVWHISAGDYARMAEKDYEPATIGLLPRWENDYVGEVRRAEAATANPG